MEHKSKREYFSRFDIGDEVDYTTDELVEQSFQKAKEKNPDADIQSLVHTPKWNYGKVFAVRFTDSKVWYDVTDAVIGVIIPNIVSDNVRVLEPEFSSRPKQ